MSNFLLVNETGEYSDYTVNILGLFSTLENAVKVLREFHTMNSSNNRETCNYLYIREMTMDKKSFPTPYYYGIDRDFLNETLKESDFLYMLLDGKIVKYKSNSSPLYINCPLSEFEEKKKSMSGYGDYKYIDCIYFETLSI